MDLFYEPHRLILQRLIECKVDFILIGGYAVNYHGYSRPTGDLDLWLNPVGENQLRFIALLEKYQFEKESIEYVKSLNFSNAEVFCMGEPPVRVDFLTKISGVDYDDADKLKIMVDIAGMKIPILHLNHLVLSKVANNRTKDKLDVEELQKIQELKKKK